MMSGHEYLVKQFLSNDKGSSEYPVLSRDKRRFRFNKEIPLESESIIGLHDTRKDRKAMNRKTWGRS